MFGHAGGFKRAKPRIVDVRRSDDIHGATIERLIAPRCQSARRHRVWKCKHALIVGAPISSRSDVTLTPNRTNGSSVGGAERASKRRLLERELTPAPPATTPATSPRDGERPQRERRPDAATVCFLRFVVGFFTSNCGDGGASTAGSTPIGGRGSLGVIGGYTHGIIIVGIARPGDLQIHSQRGFSFVKCITIACNSPFCISNARARFSKSLTYSRFLARLFCALSLFLSLFRLRRNSLSSSLSTLFPFPPSLSPFAPALRFLPLDDDEDDDPPPRECFPDAAALLSSSASRAVRPRRARRARRAHRRRNTRTRETSTASVIHPRPPVVFKSIHDERFH